MIKKYGLILGIGFLGGFFAAFIILNLGFWGDAVLENLRSEVQKANMAVQALTSPNPEKTYAQIHERAMRGCAPLTPEVAV